MKVLDHGIQVELFEFFSVIELLTHGIGLWGMLMQDLQVDLIWPPIDIRSGLARAVRYGALPFGSGAFVFSFRGNAPR